MANVSTNLMSALLNNESIDEVFRSELENAVNEVLSTELTAFLDYEKYDYSGRNSGDSHNGSVVQRETYSTPIVQGNGGTHLFP